MCSCNDSIRTFSVKKNNWRYILLMFVTEWPVIIQIEHQKLFVNYFVSTAGREEEERRDHSVNYSVAVEK